MQKRSSVSLAHASVIGTIVIKGDKKWRILTPTEFDLMKPGERSAPNVWGFTNEDYDWFLFRNSA